MPADALGLALAAAVVHAFWNVGLARARDPEAATALAFLVAIIVWAPFAVARWDVDGAAWPYIAGSAAFEAAYVVLLGTAYARADLSLVYPVARGTAPVLVLAVAALALGAATSWRQGVAVCAVGAGVLLVRGRRPQGRGTAFGLAIAVCIAGYTLVDNSGVEHADPITYLWLVMIVPTLLYLGVVRLRRPGALRAGLTPSLILVGPATLGAFALALSALERAPAAPVAAVRETSVLLVTAAAALLLRERVSPWRAAGAALVVAGVVILGI